MRDQGETSHDKQFHDISLGSDPKVPRDKTTKRFDTRNPGADNEPEEEHIFREIDEKHLMASNFMTFSQSLTRMALTLRGEINHKDYKNPIVEYLTTNPASVKPMV